MRTWQEKLLPRRIEHMLTMGNKKYSKSYYSKQVSSRPRKMYLEEIDNTRSK
jgi:hypothetical protein